MVEDTPFLNFVNNLFPTTDDDISRKFFKAGGTDQQFAFVIVAVKKYFDTYLIADEKYRNAPLVRSQDCWNDDIIEKKRFNNIDDARNYVFHRIAEIKDGNFGRLYPFRIRRLPTICLDMPDKYLSPGDHLQRDLQSGIPASHEGIYLGNGLVAHVNPENDTANASVLILGGGKKEALARIDSMDRFVRYPDQPIRIVVHCIERHTSAETCKIAKELVDARHGEKAYHILLQNCQHFASLCAIGDEMMSDKEQLIDKFAKTAGAIGAVAVGATLVYTFLQILWGEEEEVEESSESRNRKNRTSNATS